MPAKSPQTKRRAASKAPDSSSLEDDRLEGKLLEELDDDDFNFFNKTKKRKAAPAKITTGQKGSSAKQSTGKQAKPPATAKKVQLPTTENSQPSLSSSPVAVAEKRKEKDKEEAKEKTKPKKTVGGGGKEDAEVFKPAKKSKLRAVPSFDEPSRKPIPKPAVKYGARKSVAGKVSDGSKSDSDGDEDDANDAPAPTAKNITSRRPVVELAAGKISTPPPIKTSKKDEMTRKPRVVLTPPPAVESESTKKAASPSLIHSPAAPSGQEEKDTERVVKDKTKTLKRLAEYNADEAAASGAGSAGMVLDEISPPASKRARNDESSASSIDEANKDTVKTVTVAVDAENSTDAPGEPATSVEEAVTSAVVDEEYVKAAPAARSQTTAAPAKTPMVPIKAKSAPRKSKIAETAATTTPDVVSELPAIAYDKQLILKMIIAKLESSKSCDWYELSVQVGKEGIGGDIGGVKKGKKGQAKGKITGDELYELYHHVVLPALKTGKALWVDDQSPGLSPASGTIDTPAPDDVEMDELESEEEAPLPAKGQRRKASKT